MKVQEALKAAIRELEILGATSSDAYAKCKSALSDIEKCYEGTTPVSEPVHFLPTVKGMYEKVLPEHADEIKEHIETYYTSPISKEWVGLDSRFVDEIYNDYVVHENTTFEDFINRVSEKLKQLNTEKG